MEKHTESLIDEISRFKIQLIINKNLYAENIITVDTYEKMEATLMEKITNLSNELEMSY